MTASYLLEKINASGGKWTYSLPGSPLGGLEDAYLRISGECHPNFIAVPLKNRYGTKWCLRKPEVGCAPNHEIGERLVTKAVEKVEESQGYHRGSVDMYDTAANLPNQEWNPQFYSDRRTPWEGDLMKRDYIHLPINFNGTGIQTMRTPTELRDTGRPYYEYGYSFTPDEDPSTGMRTATSFSQTKSPVKWNVTQAYQPYITFQNEHEYVRNPQRWRDTKEFRRVI
jgi:hypothetical protein